MADQPKSTADILAAIRKQSGGGAPAASTPAPAASEASPPPSAPAPAPAAAAPSGPAPKGTANILAAIRAQGGGGAAAATEPAAAAPAAASAPAPKGTASILAAIRGGGSPAAAPAAAPAAKAPKTKAAPKAPAGELPSVHDMLKAVKEGVKLPSKGSPKVPAKFPAGRPGVAKGAPTAVPRRSLLAPLLYVAGSPFRLAWSLMVFLGGVLTLKGAQFMVPNMVLELPSRFIVGVPSDFPLGTVSEKFKATHGVWIVHSEAYNGHNLLYALLSVCTHLGCTPNWLQGEQKFKCPCHGSGFYISGINFEGPAPRPLERLGIRIAEDGQIEVDKAARYHEELGQWSNPKSFIELT